MSFEGLEEILGGVVGLLGPTNVGKSTLLNRLIGQKVAITTPKPQTTRKRIMAVMRKGDMEIVFVDTPGIHNPIHELGETMMKTCRLAIQDVDLILLVLSFEDPYPEELKKILGLIKGSGLPSLLAINKMDLKDSDTIDQIIEDYQGMKTFKSVIPISALKETNLDLLVESIRPFLKKGPRLFPEDMVSAEPLGDWIAEIIREKAYYFLKAELPYSTTVTVEEIKEVPQKNMLVILAKLHVETNSQKKIVIGEEGRMIKKIGQAARQELESLLNKHIYLDLFVRVEKNWTKDPKALKKLGYL